MRSCCAQQIPLPHRDPADRFLVATAQVMDLTLVTSDTFRSVWEPSGRWRIEDSRLRSVSLPRHRRDRSGEDEGAGRALYLKGAVSSSDSGCLASSWTLSFNS